MYNSAVEKEAASVVHAKRFVTIRDRHFRKRGEMKGIPYNMKGYL